MSASVGLIASFVLGLVMAWCGAPGPAGVLLLVPLAGVLALVASAPRAPLGAWRAFAAGLGFFVPFLLWLPQSFGAGFGWFGAVMFLPLYALLASFWALTAWVCLRLVRSVASRLWVLAAGWVVMEWLRHVGPLAFPWGTLGYALSDVPPVQLAELGGVLLLSLVVTCSAAALARAVGVGGRRDLRGLAALAVVWGAGWVFGLERASDERLLAGEAGRALLLRTDTNSFDKAGATAQALNDALRGQLRRSEVAGPDEVVIWSETAVWAKPDFDQRDLLPARPMITGMRFPERNSAVAWNGRVLASFDKMHPVPFGEMFPLYDEARGVYLAAFRLLGLPPLEATRAGSVARPLPLAGRSYGTYICYDSVIPSVTRALTLGGAGVLVNVSNDGYYGSSVGVRQHFRMGRVRAVETRRYVLRSVNDGIAAVIAPTGEVRQSFAGPGSGVLRARFAFREGLTPYVRWGDWPVLALAALLAVGAISAGRRVRID